MLKRAKAAMEDPRLPKVSIPTNLLSRIKIEDLEFKIYEGFHLYKPALQKLRLLLQP